MLKNLLFCHGREAYRRNTYLISYMFYKNVLYVIPIWMFGFYSKFSGTAIYNDILYQCYNIFFTGAPIIWFAVFDWEHDKETFLKDPSLYRIGLDDVFFNKTVFWRWFFYAVWQGTLLLFLAFITLDGAEQLNGQIGGITLDGNFVFAAIVIIVNIKVLINSYQYTFWSIFLVFGSIASFFLFFWGLTTIQSYTLTGEFNHTYA
jgi:magnesium-transporting ATPase (P-type)